jgi:hypothetical protein
VAIRLVIWLNVGLWESKTRPRGRVLLCEG